MATRGLFDAEWTVVVACRDNKVYVIQNGDVQGQAVVRSPVVELESLPVGIVISGKSFVVGTMDSTLNGYNLRGGRKLFSVHLDGAITSMELLEPKRSSTISAVLVSLDTGAVQCYRDEKLLHSMNFGSDPVRAMRFGRFGRFDMTFLNFDEKG
jgi:hypothetical protein